MKLATLAILLLAAMAATLPAAEPPVGEGFKAFRFVRVRNIFDPSRRTDPLADVPPPKPAPGAPPKPPFLALTGTMVRPEKSLGFFTGSSTDYNRVLGSGEAIAGYKIRSITIAGVELEKEGKPLALPVGRQLSLDAANPGTLQDYAPPDSPPPASSSSTSSSSSSTPADDADSGDGKGKHRKSPDEILRRMMERRQKENAK